MLLTEAQLKYKIFDKVRTMLNEGAWGYEPMQSDSVLDADGAIRDKLKELIYDSCYDDVKRARKEEKDFDKGNIYWNVVGIIEKYFEELPKLDSFKDEKGQEHYYMWWCLIHDKKKSIIKLYKEAVDFLCSSDEWINEWEKPDKMRKSLKKRKKTLDRYYKLLGDKIKHERKYEDYRAKHRDKMPKCGKDDYSKVLEKYG